MSAWSSRWMRHRHTPARPTVGAGVAGVRGEDRMVPALGERGARFSPCRTWRYELWRVWGDGERYVNVIGLNPSTADENMDDPTIRRCIGFAKAWGYDGLRMTNLWAFRSTDPRGLPSSYGEAVGPENDHLLLHSARNSALVLAAWGVHGKNRNRGYQVAAMLQEEGIDVQAFGFTKDGYPKHPLYLPSDTEPVPWVRF
jgi:hypothetical protein